MMTSIAKLFILDTNQRLLVETSKSHMNWTFADWFWCMIDSDIWLNLMYDWLWCMITTQYSHTPRKVVHFRYGQKLDRWPGPSNLFISIRSELHRTKSIIKSKLRKLWINIYCSIRNTEILSVLRIIFSLF